MSSSNPIDRIKELQAEIASLEKTALQDLRDRRSALLRNIAAVDAELARLAGKAVEAKSSKLKSLGKSVPLQELKEMLAAAPDKTLNIRKEGLEVRNVKVLAKANPHLLKLGGKGPWPTVTLLK